MDRPQVLRLTASVDTTGPLLVHIPEVDGRRLGGDGSVCFACTVSGTDGEHPQVEAILRSIEMTGRNWDFAVGRGKRPTRLAKGHRARLRARYRQYGEAELRDDEFLELLLTFANPRRETKSLAKRLLDRFGTVAQVLESKSAALEEVQGIGPQAATLLSLIRPLATRFLKSAPTAKNLLRSTGKAAAYFQAKLKGPPEEEIHVAFVNAKNAVMATVRLQRGTVGQSAVYVRQVIERALAHKASGFILAHNHPSGDPTPSPQDCELTQAIKAAASTVGIRFLDHLIIGKAAPFSFKANGLI